MLPRAIQSDTPTCGSCVYFPSLGSPRGDAQSTAPLPDHNTLRLIFLQLHRGPSTLCLSNSAAATSTRAPCGACTSICPQVSCRRAPRDRSSLTQCGILCCAKSGARASSRAGCTEGGTFEMVSMSRVTCQPSNSETCAAFGTLEHVGDGKSKIESDRGEGASPTLKAVASGSIDLADY
jgi:hypothetical protein